MMMGVPVVTLLGRGWPGGPRLVPDGARPGRLVAKTTDEYVTIATAAAGRVDWLAEQRGTLRAAPAGLAHR